MRWDDASLLFDARTRNEFATQAFSVVAPHTWNYYHVKLDLVILTHHQNNLQNTSVQTAET